MREVVPRDAKVPRLVPLFEIEVQVGDPQVVGPTGRGERRIVPILGGRFRGARLSGVVLPGGADWQMADPEGALDIHARYTLQTDAGALVLVDSRGVRHGPAEVLRRLAAGEAVPPSAYHFRTALRFETGAPELAWLGRLIAVAVGARSPHGVRLEAFELL